MVKFITPDEVLALRSSVLRSGLDPELCRFNGDEDESTFHLGYFAEDKLISIASFYKQPKEGFEGLGYQLRGMATHSQYQGKGIGNQLLNFSIVYLKGQKANYLWCNARKAAFRFYTGIGFELVSEEFEIEGIGPHKVMYLKIN